MSMKAKSKEVQKKYSLNPQNSVQIESRKKLSSFDHENSEEHDNGNNGFEIKPLSTKFYSNLLRLEEKVSSRNFDIETLNEIVSLYAKCVEYYDSVKDPIKYYFLEKIQITLANKASLKIMILKKNEEAQSIRKRKKSQKITNGLDAINDEDSEGEEDLEREKKNELPDPAEKSKTERYSLSKKRAERSKRLSLYMKLEEKKNEDLNNASSLLQNYEDKTENYDKIVKSDLRTQMDSLKQRLEKRKNASILKNSGFLDNSFLSASFYSDRMNHSLLLEDSTFLNRRLATNENCNILEESKFNKNASNEIKEKINEEKPSVLKEGNISPIKKKKTELEQQSSKAKIQEILQSGNHTNVLNNSTVKSNENAEFMNKTPQQLSGPRLKKSEKMLIIPPFPNESKGLALPNLNNILNNVNEFNAESPKLNKHLLHEKNKKNLNLNNIQLENFDKQKKKNQRIFSISILEKVEELSKGENLIQKE